LIIISHESDIILYCTPQNREPKAKEYRKKPKITHYIPIHPFALPHLTKSAALLTSSLSFRYSSTSFRRSYASITPGSVISDFRPTFVLVLRAGRTCRGFFNDFVRLSRYRTIYCSHCSHQIDHCVKRGTYQDVCFRMELCPIFPNQVSHGAIHVPLISFTFVYLWWEI